MEQRLRRHWRKRCFLENESAAMCAYCRAPRIILRQGLLGGSSPWLLSPYCTVAASSYLRRSGTSTLASRCFSPSKSYRSSIRMRTITSTPARLSPSLRSRSSSITPPSVRPSIICGSLYFTSPSSSTTTIRPSPVRHRKSTRYRLPVCGSVNSTCWAGARTRTGSSRRAPSPHRRFPRTAWRSGTRSARGHSAVLRAWRMR